MSDPFSIRPAAGPLDEIYHRYTLIRVCGTYMAVDGATGLLCFNSGFRLKTDAERWMALAVTLCDKGEPNTKGNPPMPLLTVWREKPPFRGVPYWRVDIIGECYVFCWGFECFA